MGRKSSFMSGFTVMEMKNEQEGFKKLTDLKKQEAQSAFGKSSGVQPFEDSNKVRRPCHKSYL